MIFPAVYFFLFIELLAVSYLDWKYKKISNVWSLINLIIFGLFLFLWPEFYKFEASSFTYSAGFLVGGFILFLVKVVGAGDAKYLASFYLLIPSLLHEKAFLSLVYSTIIVGTSLLLVNIFKHRNNIKEAIRKREGTLLRGIFGKKFSFAPVILISWVIFGWQLITTSSK